MAELFIPESIRKLLPAGDSFANIMAMQGDSYRDVGVRKTIQVTLGNKDADVKSYFIKQHFGVGWAEIFKNLLNLKLPVIGAMTEVQAIKKLNAIGIATTPLIAYGVKGCNPATQQSFVMTEDLGDIVSLEIFCADWKNNPPAPSFKRNLIIAVANLAKKLHENGLCHRDFYLCHLCLDNVLLKQNIIKLYLIDLHRMKPANVAEKRKDIAALYFSSLDIGLSKRDLYRFKFYYLNQPKIFWQHIEQRALKLYAKFHSDKFQKRLVAEKAALNK